MTDERYQRDLDTLAQGIAEMFENEVKVTMAEGQAVIDFSSLDAMEEFIRMFLNPNDDEGSIASHVETKNNMGEGLRPEFDGTLVIQLSDINDSNLASHACVTGEAMHIDLEEKPDPAGSL